MFTPRIVPLLLVLLAATTSSGMARASGLTGEPRTHDRFFFRMSVGGGVANTSISDTAGTVDFDGTAFELTVALGHALTRNVVLFVGLFGPVMIDPQGETTSPGLGQSSGTFEGTVGARGVGLCVTYYLMPANVYLSGTVGKGSLRFSLDEGEETFETDDGILAGVELGKEWWIGDCAGLGIVGGATWHSMPDSGGEADWTGVGYTLRLSVSVD